MGGPGGQDRGGWTNVPLDDQRQPIGTPQSRQQPAYTDLTGKRLTPGTQTPATAMAEPSPQSSEAARTGRAAGSGTDPNDPFAPQKPPQMPPPITPAAIEQEIKKQFPNLPPQMHAQMLAQAMAGHGPIGAFMKQQQADLWKRYAADSKTYNTYLKGSQQDIAKAAAKDASDTKAANSTAMRLDKRQSEISAKLASLKTDPTDADAFAAKSDTDKGIAAQVKTLMDEWKDNQRQLDAAHDTLKRIVTMHQNVAKAKQQAQQQWSRRGPQQRPSTPEERQGTPTGPAPAQAPGPNQPHSFWNPFGASPEAAQPGVQGPAQQVGGQPQQPPGQPQQDAAQQEAGPAQGAMDPDRRDSSGNPIQWVGDGVDLSQMRWKPRFPGDKRPGYIDAQGRTHLAPLDPAYGASIGGRSWSIAEALADPHNADAQMIKANRPEDAAQIEAAKAGFNFQAQQAGEPIPFPQVKPQQQGLTGRQQPGAPAPTDRPSGGAFPNVAAQAGRVAQDFAGQAGGQATPEDEAQVKAAIAERQKAGTYGSLNIGTGAATKAMKHAIDAINQGVPRWFVMQMLKVMDFEKGVSAATPSAQEMGQRLRQPMGQ